jgi:NADH-quinone oxidoreductase subunit H
MRAIAQMISYEIPRILSAVTVVMIVGSLSTVKIVEAQAGYHTFGLPNWFVFTPWGFAGFILFMIAATAESNRSPFDLPEGESEIIAGYYIEYSGFKFALFFLDISACSRSAAWASRFPRRMARAAGVSGLRRRSVVLRQAGRAHRGFHLGAGYRRGCAWISHELRLKFMLPMALINIIAAGVRHFMPPGVARWPGCAPFVAVLHALGRSLFAGKKMKRTGRFAE